MVGQTVSHYRIVGSLGAGGMGVVYEAQDGRLNRSVAIKFLPSEMTDDTQALERFRVEARAASALNHPNICTIYDIGEHEGRPYIVMELLRGETLRQRIGRGALRPSDVIDYGIQLADALDVAHSQGIVHRDIKPANIFLTDRALAKILDFGVAKLSTRRRPASPDDGATAEARPAADDQLTLPGTTLGTVSYMSPEQARGEPVDGRTDIFSLGVVLYEMMTGQQAFPGSTSAVIFDAILNRAPVAPVLLNPHIPPRLQDVIYNTLEKDRELRYQTAADLRADLKRSRRDVESGSLKTASGSVAAAASHAPGGSAPTTMAAPGTAGDAAAAVPDSSSATPSAAPGRGRVEVAEAQVASRQPGRGVPWPALMAATLVVAAVAVYFALAWRGAPGTAPQGGSPQNAQQTRPSPAQASMALAATAFASRDYQGAVARADEVLAAEPDHAEARRLRDEARALLDRLAASIDEGRRSLASGELDRAVQALTVAQSIQPGHADTLALSAELTRALRARPPGADRRGAAPERTPPASGSAAAAMPQVASQPAPPARDTQSSGVPARGTTMPTVGAAAPEAPPTPPMSPPAAQEPPAAPVASAPPRETLTPGASSAPATRGQPRSDPASDFRPAPSSPVRAAGASPVIDDRAAIRQVIADYERAIETRDLAAFRRVKPNLSADEESRLRSSFRTVASQDVEITVQAIDVAGQQATARIARRDTVEIEGRRQTTDSRQTMKFARAGGGWVLVEIAR